MRIFNIHTLLLIICFLFSSCSQGTNEGREKTITPVDTIKFELLESFIDSTSIGKPGNNMIELLKYKFPYNDSSFTIIKLYDKKENEWKLSHQDTVYSHNSLMQLQPEIKDYNSDGLGDFQFCLEVGANLANQVIVVFLYLDQSKTFKKIGESWNLNYSKELNMFRERYVSSTVWAKFYKLKGDTLTKAFEVNLNITSEIVIEYTPNGDTLKITRTDLNQDTNRLPQVKHLLRAWTLKDTLR